MNDEYQPFVPAQREPVDGELVDAEPVDQPPAPTVRAGQLVFLHEVDEYSDPPRPRVQIGIVAGLVDETGKQFYMLPVGYLDRCAVLPVDAVNQGA